MSTDPTIVFLHGLGETRQAWASVIQQLPEFTSCCVDVLYAGRHSGGWSLDEASDHIADTLAGQVHLVGLSLGAVIALNIAVRHPEKVASLFVSAPQYKPPRTLMRLQSLVMRILPERLVCPPETSKPEVLAVLKAVTDLDLSAGLASIGVLTRVVCGSKDRANLPAARATARLIPHARLDIISGAGHQWHQTHPELFATTVKTHLAN